MATASLPKPITQSRSTLTPSARTGWLSCELAVALTVFSKELGSVRVGASMVDLFQLTIAALGIWLFPRYRTALVTFLAFGLIVATSLWQLSWLEYPTNIFLRQILPAVFVYLGIGCMLAQCNRDKLVHIYVRLSIIAAALGMVQIVLSRVGLSLFIKNPGELDSIAYEPSHYAIIVAPAFYLVLARTNFSVLNRDFVATALLFLSLLLTKSLTGVALILICGIMASRAKFGIIAMLAAAFALPYFYLVEQDLQDERARERIESLQMVSESTASYEHGNLTVKSLFTNAAVAFNAISEGQLLGHGFGGHHYAYLEFFEGTDFEDDHHYGMNSISAHSLGIRLISEFGVLGILAVVWWLGRSFLRSGTRTATNQLWAMSFIYFLGRCFKLGGIMDYGCPMFLLAPICTRASRSTELHQSGSAKQPPSEPALTTDTA